MIFTKNGQKLLSECLKTNKTICHVIKSLRLIKRIRVSRLEWAGAWVLQSLCKRKLPLNFSNFPKYAIFSFVGEEITVMLRVSVLILYVLSVHIIITVVSIIHKTFIKFKHDFNHKIQS